MKISTPYIVSTIKTKFQAEGLIRFFTIRPYSFCASGGLLRLDVDNCILLEFDTPHEEFPEIYKSPVYRLLVIFSLCEETQFSPALQSTLRRIQDKDNIDRIVLWSTAAIDQYTVQLLKTCNTDIVSVAIPSPNDVRKAKTLTYFVPTEEGDLEYCLTLNLVAESLIKRLKKMFHLVLSEVGAAIYNKYYAKTKVATSSAMEFEETKLIELVRRLKAEGKDQVAIDIGCGTGRHSFILSKFFDEVYAYDFSPRMIYEANIRKREEDITNVIFSVNDFEYEKFLEENDFWGRCDLVVAPFGMGSFIEETPAMLRRFYNWLKPDGYVFLSFYNANSITLNVTPNWRDISLAAQVDKDNNSLEVSLTSKTRFNVFCKLFDEGTRGEINKIFNINDTITFPTIMALLPNSLLENELARGFFKRADEVIANDQQSQFTQLGYYVTVIAHKVESLTNGYFNIEQILRTANPDHEVLDHKPVLSTEEMMQTMNYPPDCVIKTIIFKNIKTEEFIAIAVLAEKQVNKTKIATALEINPNKIKFATEKEVLSIGFPVGGVAPFGFEENVSMTKFLDIAIINSSCEWLYTGMGDNRKTLKIKTQDFLKITSSYRRIEL
jgi:ubiquinone/menaquinone biosynthesis C-methylase UbiE/prolyl-tRNA editing enzyme YbaK/EbsC (Cys-tRNA(Pro) deacylase)